MQPRFEISLRGRPRRVGSPPAAADAGSSDPNRRTRPKADLQDGYGASDPSRFRAPRRACQRRSAQRTRKTKELLEYRTRFSI